MRIGGRPGAGLGHDHDGARCTNSPSNEATSSLPQRLHREHVLACDVAPALHVDAVVLDLVGVPTEPDAEARSGRPTPGRGWQPPWRSRSDRAGRPGRSRCRRPAARSPPPPSRARRTGRACACTPRPAPRRRSGGGVRRLVGMWVCSGTYSECRPRASTSRASSTGPMVWSVMNIVTPNFTSSHPCCEVISGST